MSRVTRRELEQGATEINKQLGTGTEYFISCHGTGYALHRRLPSGAERDISGMGHTSAKQLDCWIIGFLHGVEAEQIRHMNMAAKIHAAKPFAETIQPTHVLPPNRGGKRS